MAWTLTTVVACQYGGHAGDIALLLRRSLAAPPLWILVHRPGTQCGGRTLSSDLLSKILVVGQCLVLLVPLAMGLLVSGGDRRRKSS